MGVLADLYISNDNEADTYDAEPERFADRAQYKNFTALELSMLWSIMRGTEWDVALMGEFTCLLQKDGGEVLIYRLPAGMIADLARLTPQQIAELSPKWAATEELGWPAEAANEVMQDLANLARRATETARGVYPWNCV